MKRNFITNYFTALILLALFFYQDASAQTNDLWNDTTNSKIIELKKWFKTPPLIILDEKEISLEEFVKLEPEKDYRTLWNVAIPFYTNQLFEGRKGEDGFIYMLSDIEKDFPFPHRGYFKDEEYPCPAEYIGGLDSMHSFINKHKTTPDYIKKSNISCSMGLSLYINETGGIDSISLRHLLFHKPVELNIVGMSRKDFDMSKSIESMKLLLNEKALQMIEEVVNNSVDVAKKLPNFKPAQFYLKPAKFKKDIYVNFKGDYVK